MALTDYQGSAGDWRAQIKRNQRKTRLVITLFLLIYVGVGLLADVIIVQSSYQGVTASQALSALLSFKVIPYATLTMGGAALLSILITFAFYNRIMLLGTDSREITPKTAQSLQEKQLYHVVEEMKVAAGLRFMPKVFIIRADYMNAFAAGFSEKSAMVAITTGLINKLDRAELQAVMAHELSHIRHHDIKLTLTVSILSNLLLIVIDILFYSMLFKRDDKQGDNRLLLVIMVLRFVLPLITVLLTLFLSRTREYMADAGAVELMRDNSPMARALLKISGDHQAHAEQYAKAYGQTAHEQIRQASYLFDPSGFDPVKSVSNALSTHPQIEQRLEALGFKQKKNS